MTIDELNKERMAYCELYKTYVSFGKYRDVVRPKLINEGKIRAVVEYAEKLEEIKQRRANNVKNRVHRR